MLKTRNKIFEKAGKVLIHVVLTFASIIALFPVLWLLSTSFKPKADVFVTEPKLIPERMTLDNYSHVLFKTDIRNEGGTEEYLAALKAARHTVNSDGTIELVLSKMVDNNTVDTFLIAQKNKIKDGYLSRVIEMKNLSEGGAVKVLFKLKEGSNLDETIYKIYNSQPDYIFFQWIWNSFLVTMLTSFIGLFFASTTAYAFSRFKFKGRKAGLKVFLITQMFPGALLLVPLYNLLNTFNLLNTYGGLILAYSTLALPFSVWMLKGFFDTIPYEIEEAAFVEGATPVYTFYKLILPLSVPGLAVVFFYNFMTFWNEYMLAMTFMQSEDKMTLPVGLTTFTHQFATDWHYMSAAAIILTIPVLAVFFFAQKYLVSGLTSGSVKG